MARKHDHGTKPAKPAKSAKSAKPARPSKGAKGSPARKSRVVAAPGRAGLKVVAPSHPAAEAHPDHPVHWSRPHARTVVIAGGKGGVGKSNLSANLAVALGARGARVLLVDADLGQASLDLLLGLYPRYSVQHVLSGEKQPEEVVVAGPLNVRLLPAAAGVPDLADLDDYRRECLLRALGQLDQDADLVLVDTPSGLPRHVAALCGAADDVVVVTTPEMPSFSDAYALVKLLQQQGFTRPIHLLVSMADSAEEAEETAHRIGLVARRFLRLEVDSWGFVPFDPSVPRAVRRQEPVVTAFPQSPAAVAIRTVAERLWSPPDPQLEDVPHTPERLEA
jgi:flagellar biosynthesis protein FlhG